MRNRFRKAVGLRLPLTCLGALLLNIPLGCGTDDKFSAESDDEYTEPLVNAVIGTPSGVTKISESGVAQVIGVGGAASTGAAGGSSKAGAKGSTGGVAGRGSTGVGSAGKGSTGPSFGGRGSTGPAPRGGSGGRGSTGGPSAGKGPTGGSAGAVDPGDEGGFGQWHFDDCSPTSHFLRDSSGFGAHAQQALKANCVQGISGLGVNFRSAKDVVQIADQPQFTVDQHVGVAAWVNPKTVSGDQPIVIKRLNNKTSFSLGVHNGNIEMSVVLATGKTIISRAPIAANQWTHVAGMYDGTFVFLFINGQQFGQVFGGGPLRDVFAPIRIGATTQSQYFNGSIDEVFVSTQNISPSVLTSLSCIGRPSTLTVNPPSSGPVPADTTFHYDVSVQNNDVGNCGGKEYDLFTDGTERNINVFGDPSFAFVNPGETAKLGLSVSATEDADPGLHTIPFSVESFGNSFEFLNGQVDFQLQEPTGCFVRSRRELLITDVSVVDDPVRAQGVFDPLFGNPGPGPIFGTGGAVEVGGEGGDPGDFGTGGSSGGSLPGKGGAFGAGGSGPGPIPTPQKAGVWSFGYLMRQMAPTPEAAPAMTLALLQTWLTNQTVNGFTVQARPRMQQQVIDMWPKTANGELDLDQSPLRLQAIVNRIDIRNLAEGSAGEGRLVFGVNGSGNFQDFTVILEYNLVAHTPAEVNAWANSWHALGSLPFPSEQYNAALEAITRRFTDRGASPGSANGSALVELRTNEIALSPNRVWEFRSFVVSPTTGMLAPTTVKETPDLRFNGTDTFASFVNQNAAAIIAEVPGGDSHTVPLQFNGAPFMGGSVFNDTSRWNAKGIIDPEARFHASLNTCNGCHGSETNTGFLMVTPRFPGNEASLSGFITGTTVFDPFAGKQRTINDLGRRKTDLTALVCEPAPVPTK